jgi:hypothetical protein
VGEAEKELNYENPAEKLAATHLHASPSGYGVDGMLIDKGRRVRLSDAVERGPAGKSKLYELAGEHPGLFLKLGDLVIVDLDKYDEILSQLPLAEIKAAAR